MDKDAEQRPPEKGLIEAVDFLDFQTQNQSGNSQEVFDETTSDLRKDGDMNMTPTVMPPSMESIGNIQSVLHWMKLLYSPVIKGCMSEMISNMQYETLMHRMDILIDVLRSERLSINDTQILYDFLCHVLESRMDAGSLITEDMIPIAVKVMMEAEQGDMEDLWRSASKVLFLLARHYMEIVILELVNTKQFSSCCAPLSVLTTLSSIMSYPSVPLRYLEGVLPKIYAFMEAATDLRTQSILCTFMWNTAKVLGEKDTLDPSTREYLEKSCKILDDWNQMDCTEDEEDTLTSINQCHSSLAGDLQSLKPCGMSADQDAMLEAKQLGTTAVNVSPSTDSLSDQQVFTDNFVTSIVQSGDWEEILGLLRPLYQSGNLCSKITSVTVTAALMSHPDCLSGDRYNTVMVDILSLMDDKDVNIRLKVLECIKNSSRASPTQAMRWMEVFLKTLLQEMRKGNRTSLPETLNTLVAVVRMEKGKTWNKYDEILNYIQKYLGNDSQDIRLSATLLFGELIHRYRVLPCGHITRLIKEHFLPLMVNLQSSNPDMVSAGVLCLMRCFPHLGCRAIVLEEGSEWWDTTYIDAIYRSLANKHLLKPVLFNAVRALALAADREAIVRLITAVKDFIAYDQMTAIDCRNVWTDLNRALLLPAAQKAARTALQSLGNKWKSLGTVTHRKGYVFPRAWWVR